MIFIGIAGPSAAGKTTLGNFLASKYKDEFEHVRVDDYSKHPDTFPEKDGLKNWMDPSNLRFDLVYDHLRRLQRGEKVKTKTFAWRPSEQAFEYVLEPRKYVLVDGLYVLLDEAVSSMLDLKIYLDVPPEITLARRKQRDGDKFELEEFDRKITIPEYKRYGQIQKTQADVIIDGTQDIATVASAVRNLISKQNKSNV
jgi:uridine kinase